jgi:hypothetical protein
MDVNVDYWWSFGVGILCESECRTGGKKDGAAEKSDVAGGHLEFPFGAI